MNTNDDITEQAGQLTVINDGQVKYPVETAKLNEWTAKNGAFTTSNYEQFCEEVECIGEKAAGTPGNAGMIQLCDALVEAGAGYITLG